MRLRRNSSFHLSWGGFACEIEGTGILAVAKVLANTSSVSLEDFAIAFSVSLSLLVF